MRVAVTGAAGYLGSRLVRALADRPGVEAVLAVDLRPLPFAHPRVLFRAHDVAQPLGDLLRGFRPTAVVPLAFLLRPGRDRARARRVDVEGLLHTLRACGEAGVRRVLYLSSTTVYGAHPDNPVPIPEEAPLRPNRGFVYAEHKVEAEALLARYAREHPSAAVTVLRAPPVLGPGTRNFITAALFRPVMVGVRGADPPLQFLHLEDCLSACLRLLEEPVGGTFNLASEGTLRWSEVARLAGRPLLRLPYPLLAGLVQATWRLRLQADSPAAGLAFIRWPWVADTARIREAVGFRPAFTSRQAVEAALGKANGYGIR